MHGQLTPSAHLLYSKLHVGLLLPSFPMPLGPHRPPASAQRTLEALLLHVGAAEVVDALWHRKWAWLVARKRPVPLKAAAKLSWSPAMQL